MSRPLFALATVVLLAPVEAAFAADTPAQLSAWSLQELSLPAGTPNYTSFTVELDGQPRQVTLYKRSIRASGFEVLVDEGQGALNSVTPPPVRTYRGILSDDETSGVAGSLLEDGFSGMIRLEDGSTWIVEPLTRLAPDAVGDTRHVVYRAEDVVMTDHHCGLDTSGIVVPPAEGGVAGTTPNYAVIGIDSDYEFFQKNSSNVATTVNDIELIMNNVDFIYDRDVNIAYEVSTIIVRSTVSDPYSATVIGDRLCEFRNKWNATPESAIQRDLAHMFSGVSFSGGVIGVAYLGVACNVSGNNCGGNGNLAYGIVESKYLSSTPLYLRISLSCHEIGHNWEATHCDAQGNANCHIMCSANDACGGVAGSNLKFDPLSITEITNYKNSVACEPPLPGPTAPPFTDNFPSLTISTTKWIYNKGATGTTSATNEPSPTVSMNLDSAGSNAYDDDEVRSNFILLGGVGSAYASYWTQHKGVEAGKSLFVEYLNSTHDWTALETIVSNGTDETNFVFHEFQLPANALHNDFRIRFRTDGSDATDDWYIDDVTVAVGQLCPADTNGDGTVDGADIGYLLSKWNTNDAAADIDDSGLVDGADIGLLIAAWGPC